jgi:hypothetical protein
MNRQHVAFEIFGLSVSLRILKDKHKGTKSGTAVAGKINGSCALDV